MLLTNRITDRKPMPYASRADFCRIFQEEMNSLYQLAFLLAGDPAKAERCFVAGLDDCVAGNPVFQEWARSWTRRAIIQQAIRLLAPRPEAARYHIPNAGKSGIGSPLAGVLELSAFDRFSFVMSVLENYSDRDCALLLGCTRQDVIEARGRALQRLAVFGSGSGQAEEPMAAALIAN